MALPPTQPCDHTPIVVLQSDSAWRLDRIDRELGIIGGTIELDEGEERPPWPTVSDHPYIRYMSGTTRYHLSPDVEAFLDEQAEPVRFELARLDDHRWRAVQGYLAKGLDVEARTYALRHALRSITGLQLKLRANDGDAMSESALGKLRRLLGDAELDFLANAAVQVSRELQEPEKKP